MNQNIFGTFLDFIKVEAVLSLGFDLVYLPYGHAQEDELLFFVNLMDFE